MVSGMTVEKAEDEVQKRLMTEHPPWTNQREATVIRPWRDHMTFVSPRVSHRVTLSEKAAEAWRLCMQRLMLTAFSFFLDSDSSLVQND